MVHGGVLNQDESIRIGIHEYITEEPVIVGRLDPPDLPGNQGNDPEGGIIEFIVDVVDMRASGLCL
jgi:hypothetical protein